LTELPEVGQVVGVYSGIDKDCYRGLVTRRITQDSVLIFFLDHGNKEIVKLKNIFSLPEYLTQVSI
jgi:hypothetical protein